MGGRGSRWGGYEYANITGPATSAASDQKEFTIHRGTGILGSIIFNGGTLGSGTIKNATTASSGVNIASFGIPAANFDGTEYNVRYNQGLVLVLASASNVTVTFLPES